MAEATVSAAQVRKRRDPSFPGYDTYLDDRMRAVLPGCLKRGTRIITNQGLDQSPTALRNALSNILREHGAQRQKGRRGVRQPDLPNWPAPWMERFVENARRYLTIATDLISAEAYLGAEPIVAASLEAGADIVVTGRVADPHCSWRR